MSHDIRPEDIATEVGMLELAALRRVAEAAEEFSGFSLPCAYCASPEADQAAERLKDALAAWRATQG